MMQIVQQVKKQLLFSRDQLTLFHDLSEQAYQQAQQQHLDDLPTISNQKRVIVKQLQQQGIVITSLAQLENPLTPQLLIDTDQIIPHLTQVLSSSKNQYMMKASPELLLQYPSLFCWGSDLKLLNLIENYLGLPVAYHGVYLRRYLANNVKKKTRLWHLDKEDRKMFKVIIYLNDVCEDSGPLQYISKELTPWIFHKSKYNYGRISDLVMEKIVSSSHWKSCIGKSGTVVLIDPASIFHRGKIPINSDRFSLFFDYTSRQPKHPYFCKPCCEIDELIQLSRCLNQEAKNCIFWNLKLQQQYIKTVNFL